MTAIQVVITLLTFTVYTGGTGIQLDHEEKSIDNERGFGYKSVEEPKGNFLRKRTVETGGHGNQIDNPNVDANSLLENIIESEKIFVGGKAEKPKGLHENDKQFEKEENNEDEIVDNDNGQKRLHNDKEKEQEEQEEREVTQNSERLKERNFPSYFSFENGRLWPNGVVPYVVDETSYGTNILDFNNRLGQTIDIFDRETCISFKPKSDALLETLGHQNFVKFYNGGGCSSPVGVSKGIINIKYWGCTSVSTIFHEMCHTIGMKHEQSRTDRDLHMLIKWSNIKDGKQGNFVKGNTKTHDSLDPFSVMQYSLWSFSKNDQPTIILKNDDYLFLVNANRNYSFYDIADINYVYKCSDKCATKPACKYKGFVNKECTCRCPDGLKGDTCNELDGNCGGFIDLSSGSAENITSPNWPNKHDVNQTCVWVITAPTDHRIRVKIIDMDLAYTDYPYLRCYHWVSIHGNLIGEPGLKRCGKLSNNEKSEYFHVVNKEANLMMIRFDSLYANDRPPATGFKLEVKAFKSGCLKRPCKMGGTCVEGNNDFTYTCICPQGYSGENCTNVKANATVKCDFEIDFAYQCFLQNVKDWRIDYRKINILANDTDVFAAVNWPGNPSIMISDVEFEASERCLMFDYYNTGSLKVFYESDDFSGRREALSVGTTTAWTKAYFHFPKFNGLKITFEGTYGDGGLKAVDNVVIVPGSCGVPCSLSNPCLNEGTCVVSGDKKSFTCDCVNGYKGQLCEFPSNLTSFACTSEPEDQCFLTDIDTDNLNWNIHTLGTASSSTGPNSAYQGNYYRYLEASFVEQGKRAVMVNLLRDLPETKRCLIFHYHMYGSTMGTLNVKTNLNDGEIISTVWSKSGDQGNNWQKAVIDLPSAPRFNVEFEGIVGSGFMSDIAFDDVILRPGVCGCASNPCVNGGSCTQNSHYTFTCQCTAGFAGTLCDTIDGGTLQCTFESGDNCFLSQAQDDNSDWLIHEGGTPSSGTGPDGAQSGSKYIYMEASFRNSDEKDRLITNYTFTSRDRCLSFYYHMYGLNMGTLRILVNDTQEVFKVSEDKGNTWTFAEVDIPAVNDLKITVEGIRGASWSSDIALDNIKLEANKCGNTAKKRELLLVKKLLKRN